MNIAKFSRTAFFIEHLRWLFLQLLYKKAVPKNFANLTRTFRYWSPILSSCWLTTCHFVIIVGRGEVLCCEFGEIFQNNFMRNNFERLLLNVKVTLMQIWNLSVCPCSYKNDTLKFQYCESWEFSSYLSVNFTKCLFTNNRIC